MSASGAWWGGGGLLLALAGCQGAGPMEEPDGDDLPVEPSLVIPYDAVVVQEGTSTELSAEATGGEVTWSFGDGGEATGDTVAYTWAEAGNYVAVASLVAEDGRRLTASVRAEVYRPRHAEPPVWSATLALDADGRVWAVTPEADTVAIVDAFGSTHLSTCHTPRTVGMDAAAGTAAVACDDGTLAVYDLADDSEAARVDLGAGSHPYGVAGRDGTWWVTLAGTGQVAEVGGDVVLHDVGADPRGIALGDDVYVSRFRSEAGGGAVYRLGGEPIALPMHPGPDSDTIAGGVPTLVQQLALSPDRQTLYVPALQANVARGLLGTGEPLTFESTVRAALGVVAVDAAEEDWSVRKQLDNQDRVVAVAPSPTGNWLAIAHPGTQTIQVLDAFTLDAVGSIHDAGAGITGLVWDSSNTLYVHAWLDRVVRAYTMGEPGTLPQLAWQASVVEEEPLAEDVLAGKKLFHASGDARIAKDGYIACASCHPDGTHDGLTWDFTSRGEGLRNTTTLVGRGGTGMGFLHWSANFDEVQDFENDIRNAFGGTGLLSDADWAETSDTLGAAKAGRSADLDALAAYVTSLDETPVSPWAADVTDAREALFVADCASCHPAPLYTDSALGELRLHDVGTLTDASGGRLGGPLEGLDTPTLLGAWATPPYLHDGSAPTIEAAIRAHTTIPLDEGTIAELTAFVQGL